MNGAFAFASTKWLVILAALSGLASPPADMRAIHKHGTAEEASSDYNTVAARECPGPYMEIVEQLKKTSTDPAMTLRYTQVKVAGPISQVAEFHDCQQFIETDASYGQPMYAVFASYKLETIDRVISRKDGATAETIAAGAEVYTRLGTYEKLGIKPGFNCIYFSTVNQFKIAYVTNGYQREEKCELTRLSELADAQQLHVRRVTYADFKKDDYPPVARWQRHAEGQYFIGMRCGDAWCEVGTPDVAETAQLMAGVAKPTFDRVRDIPGWNDEQVLALPSGAGVKPGSLRGRVIPDFELGSKNAPAAFANWSRTARISLSDGLPGDLATYKSKLGLTRGDNGLAMRFYVRDHGDSYRGIGELPIPMQNAIKATHRDTVWVARVISAAGDTSYFRVIRTDHSKEDFTIPGTVRWRWQSRDETIWARCLEGCCQVQQPE